MSARNALLGQFAGNSGYLRVWVYGPRIWPLPPETTLGRHRQPARIHLPFSWKWPSSTLTRSEGRQCAGPRVVEGQLPAWRRCQHSGPPLGGSRRCSARNPWLAASDGWSLQPPDRWDAACQPSSCPSSSSNLEADRLHRGPDWSDQLTATYFPRQLRHPLTLGLQPTFVMSVSKLTIFSGPQSCGGLNYWPCHPSTKSNPASHWVIVHGDMASQRARCGQISSFVAFAIHVNGGKDKLLHESAQFCRQGSHWRVSYAI